MSVHSVAAGRNVRGPAHCPCAAREPRYACVLMEYRSPKPIAACVMLNAGHVLLLKRAIPPGVGKWALPAGYIEPGESAEEAVRREVKEETGIEITPEYLTSWGREVDAERSFLGLCFIERVERTQVVLDEESLGFEWVSMERAVLESVDWAFDSHRDVLMDLVSELEARQRA